MACPDYDDAEGPMFPISDFLAVPEGGVPEFFTFKGKMPSRVLKVAPCSAADTLFNVDGDAGRDLRVGYYLLSVATREVVGVVRLRGVGVVEVARGCEDTAPVACPEASEWIIMGIPPAPLPRFEW